MNNLLTPRSDNPIIRWWLSIDRPSFFMIMALVLFGIVMVATASPSVAMRIGLNEYHFLIRHVMFLVPACTCLIFASTLSQKWIWCAAIALFVLSIGGVILSLISGAEIKGATRWIRIFGFSLQPSEFLKPSFIILSAWVLSLQKLNPKNPYILSAIILYCISATLLILQPDFGMMFLITCVFAMQIFLMGCPLRYIVIISGFLVMGVIVAYFTLSHVQSRIDRFLYPETTDTYQIDKSKEAFINGSITGEGPGQGTIKNTVPDIHSDFIFTAIGEEWGFAFTSLFVILLIILYYRLFIRFSRSESMFIMLAGGGLVFMLAVQSFIHMGSTIALIPAKGMTLPFISYGGSSLVAVGISFGLILALSRNIPDNHKRSNWRHLKKKV